jgi:hypothetical protein
MYKAVVIYFDKDKKSFQIIKPTNKFAGDWEGLVHTVTKEAYYRYELI